MPSSLHHTLEEIPWSYLTLGGNSASANLILLEKYVGIRFINFAVDNRCADIKFLTW